MRKIPKYNSLEYWKSADEYRFKIKNSKNILSLYAHSPRIAKIKARNWEKWLVRTKRGKSKVNFKSVQKGYTKYQ